MKASGIRVMILSIAVFLTCTPSLADQATANKVASRAEQFHKKFVNGNFGNIDNLAQEYLGKMGAVVVNQVNAQNCEDAQKTMPLMISGTYNFIINGKVVQKDCTSRATSAVVVNNLF